MEAPVATIEEKNQYTPPLPNEILTEILARLPAKSAARFRCLSREWSALLSSAYFVDLHARRTNRSDHPRLLLAPAGSNYDGYIYSWQQGGQVEKLMPDDFPVGYPIPLTKPCHGLILIQCTCNAGYFGCNPSTGAILPLPDSETPFKMVWRPSIRNQIANSPIADSPPTHANGNIYWLVEPNLGPILLRCEIVSFNVEACEFEVLKGPPCSHDNGRISILQLQGALCVACSDKRMNVIDIWMMKDTDTWVMEYHIELKEFSPEYMSEYTTPLAVDPKDGRILLHAGLSIGYYDCKMVAPETIYSVGMPNHDYSFKFCPIIADESLVCPLGLF